MSIGKEMLRVRLERGMTQGEVGRRSNLATSYISRIENNHIQPTMGTLSKLAQALEVPLSSIFRSNEDTKLPTIHHCPVSSSGKCVGEQLRSHHGRRPNAEFRYDKETLRLLKMADFIAVHGSKEIRRTLTVVLESLISHAGKKPGGKKT